MTEARIDGAAVPLDDAIAEAARLLRDARCPVICGLATDVAGVEAAARLAAQIGGVLDHDAAAPLLRDLDALREGGWLVTTPLQVRARADVVVLLGSVSAADLGLHHPPPLAAVAHRKVIALGAAETAEERMVSLGVLRALVAGRPVAPDAPHRGELAQCAAALKAARYAVIAWSAADLDALAVHMICGLIDDLNAVTRCAGLAVVGTGNAAGVAQALAWRTGFPVRVGFGRGHAEHDPWRFDSARLIASGEADATLWVAAIPVDAAIGPFPLPTVALSPASPAHAPPPRVAIVVGQPGVDHDAVLFDRRLGALAFTAASAPSARPSAGAVLSRMAAAVGAH